MPINFQQASKTRYQQLQLRLRKKLLLIAIAFNDVRYSTVAIISSHAFLCY
jgi:hypothetical protein